MKPRDEQVAWQRDFYRTSAVGYDKVHGDHEHALALALMVAAIDTLGVQSVLDVGSGTGRALVALKRARPDVRVLGIEPVAELRQVGHARGLSRDELIEGDATALQQASESFDLVCEFGVLHHVAEPRRAVAQMLRVARRAVFISDSNNFGQGSVLVRTAKQLLHAAGLWPLADYLKTRGRGYTISEGDGLAYSYSVFDDYPQIRRACSSVHLMNTGDAGTSLYRTSTHITLLGIK